MESMEYYTELRIDCAWIWLTANCDVALGNSVLAKEWKILDSESL